MEPSAVTIEDTLAIILLDSVVCQLFYDKPVRINAACPEHQVNSKSAATRMLFTGMGGPSVGSDLG